MKHLLIPLFCILFISCESNKATFSVDDYLHVIDLSKTEPVNMNLSKLFVNITPIILETTKESLLGSINKVVVTSEYIIVLDAVIAKALFLFKKDGTFLRKFGRIGLGPGEYSLISDFYYDTTTGTIYMLDARIGKINLYNIHTGEFLKSIKLQSSNGVSRFICYQAGEIYADLSYFTNENGRYLLNRINQSTGRVEEAWFDLGTYSKNVDHIERNPFLISDENSFKFNTCFMDGIMLVEKNKIIPFLAFTPEYTLNRSDLKSLDLKNITMNFYDELFKVNKVFNISTYFEYKDILFLQFNIGKTIRTVIYNQKTKDFKVVKVFFDDLFYSDINHFSFPSFLTCDDNGMYSRFGDWEMNILKNDIEKDVISDKYKSVAMDLANLETDANPILLYYEFKD